MILYFLIALISAIYLRKKTSPISTTGLNRADYYWALGIAAFAWPLTLLYVVKTRWKRDT